MTLVHIVCRQCATALHGTDSERPHEAISESERLADLFRMSHHGHGVRELVVE